MTDFVDWAASNDYLVMWAVYLLGVVGLLIVAWRLTRSWPRWLSLSLRFILACLLLVPAMVESERHQYAPAWVVAPFDWLSKGPEQAAPAINALLLWTLGALAVVLLAKAVHYLWVSSRRKRAAAEADGGSEKGSTAQAEAP
ncbi:MAG: hypothetical protein AB8B86_00725 [Pseudomonadales bacterium]